MSLRLRAAIAAAFIVCAFGALPAMAAGEFTDSAGRIVVLPDRVNRVMPANWAAEALIFVLDRNKLGGLGYGPPHGTAPRYGQLPIIAPLAGPNAAAMVARLHPDVIIDAGPVTPARVAFADQTTKATGVPYLIIDNSLDRTPTMLRVVGRLLGVADRGDDLAGSAEHAINALRGRLLIQPATQRPRVYYGRGPSGLETVLPGSEAAASIEAAGAINVASARAPSAPPTVTLQQLREWNPDIIIAEDRGFYAGALRNPGLAEVRNHKVFLEPSEPFGWIDDPAGVNRLIGLYWLSQIFYPGDSQDDLRSLMADFYDKFYGIKLSDAQIGAIAKTAGIPPSDTPHLAALPGLGTVPGGANPAAPEVPGAVNEPGRRGVLPNETPPAMTTPSYLMPK
ncbi:MAG: ABC transporter substrate-binding protein [Stellaceae bacterium]